MTAIEELGALLDAPPPDASAEEAALLARDRFGLRVQAHLLTGERDRNFHLRAHDGAEYVLKVIHPAELADVSDFQSRALLHLAEADPTLPVPRLIRPLEGDAPEALWQPHGRAPCRIRVLTYLPGRPLHLAPASTAQRHAVGDCLARLDRGLSGFHHPADGHELLWDIQRASQLRRLIPHLPEPADRDLATTMLDRFETRAVPLLPQLRRQVLHNDFNPHNILADALHDDRIAGIIDFGDMVRGPLVQDLATACAYQLLAVGHPLAAPLELARAFHAVTPLLPEEIGILADLIATRLVVTLTISGWRAAQQPENADYILRNYGRSLGALRRLGALPAEAARDYLQEGLTP